MVKRTATLFGILAVVLGSTAFAIERVGDVAPVAKRAAAEVSINPLTVEGSIQAQRELHDWLITQAPAGLDKATISIAITDQDRASLGTQANLNGQAQPMRVGVVKAVHERVGMTRGQSLSRSGKSTSSVFAKSADGGFVWATTITTTDAVALRVHFEDFSLPANAEMYIFNAAGEAFGPYVGTGLNDTGEFWSHSLSSSTGMVLLRQFGADDSDDQVSFRIADVAHVALDFPRPQVGGIASFCQFNEACIVNNSCTSDPAVSDAEQAVAKMRWIGGAFVNICSGGLMADTDGSSQIPYFLTANHCISKNNVASNLEAYFQYTVSCGTSTCAGSFDPAPVPPSQVVLGASIRATNRNGDFTLLELDSAAPAGSILLGWNSSPIANTNGAALHRVHHPSGAPQAYSEHAVDTGAGTCQGWPRGERIYSADITGATEGGSSGSPVVNAAGEVVGQLSGCCGFNCGDVCDSGSNSTVDGAFAFYFSSVEEFLDPQGGGDPVCGDGTCDAGEDACNCPADCSGACCGDGTCDAGEDNCNCPADCSGSCSCGGNKAPCSENADCCSNNCKNGSCKGN